MSVFSDIKKAFRRLGRLEGDFRRLGSRVEDAYKDARSAAGEVSKLWVEVKGVRRQIEQLPEVIESKAEQAAHKVYQEIREEAEDLVDDVVGSLGEALARKGLEEFRELVGGTRDALEAKREKRPDLIDEIDNMSVYLELGPVTMTWEGFYTRAEQVAIILDHYVDNPPAIRRKDILEFIAAVGPTSVDAGLSIQAALLVVSSKELSIGGGLGEIRLALFLELGDAIMDALGVPE